MKYGFIFLSEQCLTSFVFGKLKKWQSQLLPIEQKL